MSTYRVRCCPVLWLLISCLINRLPCVRMYDATIASKLCCSCQAILRQSPMAAYIMLCLDDRHPGASWSRHHVLELCKSSPTVCRGRVITGNTAGHAGTVQEAARAAAAELVKQLQQGPMQGAAGSNGAAQAAAANWAPKGYKGNPNDTRADAFRKMQV